jgi:hypothetical protein
MARRPNVRDDRPRPGLEPLEDRVVLSGSSPSYISMVYADVLHRPPTSQEVGSWAQQIQGGRSPVDLTKGLVYSTENRANEVTQDYQVLLHRGASSADVRELFLNSPEYKALHPGTTAFVDALYHDVLGRNPDPQGEAFYVNILDKGGSTATVVSDIVSSPERAGKLVDLDYNEILGRNDTAQEHVARVNLITSGKDQDETLLAGVLASPENIKNHDGSLS